MASCGRTHLLCNLTASVVTTEQALHAGHGAGLGLLLLEPQPARVSSVQSLDADDSCTLLEVVTPEHGPCMVG